MGDSVEAGVPASDIPSAGAYPTGTVLDAEIGATCGAGLVQRSEVCAVEPKAKGKSNATVARRALTNLEARFCPGAAVFKSSCFKPVSVGGVFIDVAPTVMLWNDHNA